jgi:acetyl-CoA C-acetyltransferase
MKPVYLAGAVRTPIGRFGGSLASWTAADLGTAVAQESLKRANVRPDQIDDSIWGCARQAGGGPNVARQITFRAGVPDRVPAFTVNQACGSGLRAIILAAEQITLGRANIVLAGGTESMSRVPYFAARARWGTRMGHVELVDGMYRDGFNDPLSGLVMGETAEELARRYEIARDEQDDYALRSQQRAANAIAAGRFEAEILPLELNGAARNSLSASERAGARGEARAVTSPRPNPLPAGEGKDQATLLAEDEHVRANTTIQSLRKLPPVFSKDGTVTAGNSSGITDGAAAVVVMSEEAVKKSGAEPLARIVDYEIVGVAPEIMGIGPVPATRAVLERQELSLSDIDLVELNEAFAAQVIACDRDLQFDQERLNVNGGAIALGHPIGCTGVRITTTLLHEMERRKAKRGLATLCISGGMGIALLVESI